MNATEMVETHLPGWVLASLVGTEEAGVLVRVQRFNRETRCSEWRTVWIDTGGATDAHIDELGYVVTDDGRKL